MYIRLASQLLSCGLHHQHQYQQPCKSEEADEAAGRVIMEAAGSSGGGGTKAGITQDQVC